LSGATSKKALKIFEHLQKWAFKYRGKRYGYDLLKSGHTQYVLLSATRRERSELRNHEEIEI